MPKSIYEMDTGELERFVREQPQRVDKLHCERPNSAAFDFASDVLRDARQLLAEMKKRPAG